MRALFVRERFTHVVHLAAQPGVRRSLTHPYDYLRNNIEGFLTLLETVREYPVEHLVYASSSSVYGTNSKIPFSESDPVDRPESLYAASKRSDELMAHVYTRLYGVPATGLRFFTVYGPWGRPDMAPMLFGRAIMEEKAIRVFNHGEMKRDFTYIDDIVGGIEKVLFGGWKQEGLHVYNIGHGSPVDLMEFIGLLEKCLGREAPKEMLGMQPGDVPLTYADTSALAADYGYRADTPLEEGLRAFAEWLKDYRKDG
jgi:putative UDP-glucuronic acid epimerase